MANPGHTKCIDRAACSAEKNMTMYGNNQCVCMGDYRYSQLVDSCISFCSPGQYMDGQGRCMPCEDGSYSGYAAEACTPC